jgi:hypothetical protein
LSHRYCYLPLSWKSWNRFECAVGGVRHPQHTASCWIYIERLLGAHPILHISRIRVNLPHFWLRYIEVSENKVTNILMSRTLFGMRCMQSIVADGTHQTPPNSPLTQISNRDTNASIPRSKIFSVKCA